MMANPRSKKTRTLDELGALPDDAMITIEEFISILKCSRTTHWRLVEKGILPEPVQLGARFKRYSMGTTRAAMRGEAA